MKIVAIIQARMGATRLPGKTMMRILDKPIIQYVVEQTKRAKLIKDIWLATTINPEDDVLAEWAKDYGLNFYRGSVNDVLDRYYQTALLAKPDVVTRITGDCPLIDPEVIDKTVGAHLKGDSDYTCNREPPTYPDGQDTEVFSFQLLERTWREAKLPSEREHVMPYVWEHPDKFKIKNVTNNEDLSRMRWTLDTKEDFEFIKLIIEECDKQGLEINMRNVLMILRDNPEWEKINSRNQRNEGYVKSKKEDDSLIFML